MSGIYKIESLSIPERCYIGSAVNVAGRWCRHVFDLKNDNHCNKKLQNHYNKYGKNDLIFSVIINCNREDLILSRY
jgi:group I intron endonuclease